MSFLSVLQREMEFSPEMRVSAAQSLQQQVSVLLQLAQQALGALILFDKLLRAHRDPQQARLVEDIVGIAEAFQFVAVHGDGIMVFVWWRHSSPFGIGGQGAASSLWS